VEFAEKDGLGKPTALGRYDAKGLGSEMILNREGKAIGRRETKVNDDNSVTITTTYLSDGKPRTETIPPPKMGPDTSARDAGNTTVEAANLALTNLKQEISDKGQRLSNAENDLKKAQQALAANPNDKTAQDLLNAAQAQIGQLRPDLAKLNQDLIKANDDVRLAQDSLNSISTSSAKGKDSKQVRAGKVQGKGKDGTTGQRSAINIKRRPDGTVVEVTTDKNGNVVTVVKDKDGKIISQGTRRSDGTSTETTTDKNGNVLIVVKDKDGKIISQGTRRSDGTSTETTTDKNGSRVTVNRDKDGNVISQTTTTTTRRPDGTVLEVVKDKNGNTISQTTSSTTHRRDGTIVTTTKDKGGNVISQTTTTTSRRPDGTVVTVTKDKDGNIIPKNDSSVSGWHREDIGIHKEKILAPKVHGLPLRVGNHVTPSTATDMVRTESSSRKLDVQASPGKDISVGLLYGERLKQTLRATAPEDKSREESLGTGPSGASAGGERSKDKVKELKVVKPGDDREVLMPIGLIKEKVKPRVKPSVDDPPIKDSSDKVPLRGQGQKVVGEISPKDKGTGGVTPRETVKPANLPVKGGAGLR
jgi:hypothetical protein